MFIAVVTAMRQCGVTEGLRFPAKFVEGDVITFIQRRVREFETWVLKIKSFQTIV